MITLYFSRQSMAQGRGSVARKADSLKAYREKRDFRSTPEPKGGGKAAKGRRYVIQKHDASRLHYDFRLEFDGVLKSWAVPKGPSLDPADKRLAVRTEDHPIEYASFEGVIPSGYGAGTVLLWDQGEWEPDGDAQEGIKKGELKFTLKGERLKGGFALVRFKPERDRENWLLIKERDRYADEKTDPTKKWEDSVKSGRTLKAVSEEGEVYKKREHSRRSQR